MNWLKVDFLDKSSANPNLQVVSFKNMRAKTEERRELTCGKQSFVWGLLLAKLERRAEEIPFF